MTFATKIELLFGRDNCKILIFDLLELDQAVVTKIWDDGKLRILQNTR